MALVPVHFAEFGLDNRRFVAADYGLQITIRDALRDGCCVLFGTDQFSWQVLLGHWLALIYQKNGPFKYISQFPNITGIAPADQGIERAAGYLRL